MLQLLMRHTPLAWIARRPDTPAPCQQALAELPLRLLQQPHTPAPLEALLAAWVAQTPARRAWLRLPDAHGRWQTLGEAADDCPHELALAGEACVCRACRAAGRHRLICPLRLEQGRQGLLLLDYPQPPAAVLQRQASRFAAQLGEVLRAVREARQSPAPVDSAALARELHDSVAQRLGYLQIRARRLEAVLAQPAEARAMLDDLQQQLQCVHRQVRELIASARLTLDGRSLRQALEASVEEFARASSCVFSLDNRLPAEHLPEAVAFETLQIVREALTNVVRHSHARQVRIVLREWDGAGFEAQVQDDGQGIGQTAPGHGHYGLRIMHERAEAIGATLAIGPAEPCGTRVCLRWRPL